MQWFFLIAAIFGTILPLSYLAPFFATNGLDMPLFFRQVLQNNIAGFFAMDVIVSSVALWAFVFSEGRRLRMSKLWVYIACNLVVGVSLAFPLFLFFRERQLQSRMGRV